MRWPTDREQDALYDALREWRFLVLDRYALFLPDLVAMQLRHRSVMWGQES